MDVDNGHIEYKIPLSREERNRVRDGTLNYTVVCNEHDYYNVTWTTKEFYDPPNINFKLLIDDNEPINLTTDDLGYFTYLYNDTTRLGKIPVIAMYEVDEDTTFSKNLTFNVAKLTVQANETKVLLDNNVTLSGNLDYVSNITLKINITDETFDDWIDDGRVNITIGSSGKSYIHNVRVLHGFANSTTITLNNDDFNEIEVLANQYKNQRIEINETNPLYF